MVINGVSVAGGLGGCSGVFAPGAAAAIDAASSTVYCVAARSAGVLLSAVGSGGASKSYTDGTGVTRIPVGIPSSSNTCFRSVSAEGTGVGGMPDGGTTSAMSSLRCICSEGTGICCCSVSNSMDSSLDDFSGSCGGGGVDCFGF